MKFTKIQDHQTRQIIAFKVNNKEVTQQQFDDKHHQKLNSRANYNTSFTTRNKQNNFVHTYYL